MKKSLIILPLLLLSGALQALGFNPFKGPKPIAVLVQTNPWLMVVGSDTPMVTIYEDGQVVYLKRRSGKKPELYHKRLAPGELKKVKQKLQSFGDYANIKRRYNLAEGAKDLPETKIYLALKGKEIITSVYGLMVSRTGHILYGPQDGEQKSDALPRAIKDLHLFMATLDFADASEWTPPYVEVMIWDYEYAPDRSIQWPKKWPGLKSKNALKRGDSYSIFLSGNKLYELRLFLKKQRERGAVEIDGKKWAVSARYTFPSELIWSRAFRGKK